MEIDYKKIGAAVVSQVFAVSICKYLREEPEMIERVEFPDLIIQAIKLSIFEEDLADAFREVESVLDDGIENIVQRVHKLECAFFFNPFTDNMHINCSPFVGEMTRAFYEMINKEKNNIDAFKACCDYARDLYAKHAVLSGLTEKDAEQEAKRFLPNLKNGWLEATACALATGKNIDFDLFFVEETGSVH